MTLRLLALAVCVAAGSMAKAGPVAVRSWITPKPGQTPFDPPPGEFAPECTLDLTPGGWGKVASFVPDDRWAAPDEPYTPGESKAGSRQYAFTYHAELTDAASGRSEVFTLDGLAEAEWMQRYDGLVLVDRLAVRFAAPGSGFARGGEGNYRLEVRETVTRGDWLSSEVGVVAMPAAVPEPGTLALAVGGLVVAAGAWRRKRRRAVLTSDQLPQ